jgi:undecaprenyl-diphosphatase
VSLDASTVAPMSWSQVVGLAIVQGLTEFLPVSSAGHLAVVSRLFFAGDAGASFTAVTQLGTEVAVLVYFAKDIARIARGWICGLVAAAANTRVAAGAPGGGEGRDVVTAHRDADYRMGWYVIIGTIPICVLGLVFADQIRSGVRNLWVVATALVVFAVVIAAAEYFGRQTRHVERLTYSDAIVVGLAQTLALVPGVSRSGATISAGLFVGLDRELAARFGFLLAIPAVFASGLFSLPDAFHPVGAGMSATGPQLLAATLIAFGVGWAAVAWFLRFLVHHSMYWFVGYRVVAGLLVLGLLATGVVTGDVPAR